MGLFKVDKAETELSNARGVERSNLVYTHSDDTPC